MGKDTMNKDEKKDISLNAEDMSIEECFKEIEKMIDSLNSEDLSLENSFEIYNKAVNYVKACNLKIDRVEKEIKKIETGLTAAEE